MGRMGKMGHIGHMGHMGHMDLNRHIAIDATRPIGPILPIRPILLILLLTLLQSVGRAQPSARLEQVRAEIDALLDQPKFESARWGILVRTTDGRTIYERDAREAFIPASNTKLYTTAAVLDRFGPEARLKTTVWATRKPSAGGLLAGDLILYGRGDPNLSPRFADPTPRRYSEMKPAEKIPAIEALAEAIRSKGIRRISGRIIGDDSYFAGDLLGPGWEWDDAMFYYGAETSALTVNDNSVTLEVSPGARVGEAPGVKILPETGYVTIVNRARTVASGVTRIGVHRPLGSNTIEIFGSIARRAAPTEIDIAIHNPALFAATLLREALARRGIRVAGKTVRIDAVDRVAMPLVESKLIEIASLESEPISELIRVVNKQSQNLHAELMLRQLGKSPQPLPEEENAATPPAALDDYGRPFPTIARGNAVRREFLQRAGVESGGLNLRDGSGLARQNLVTPASTVRLLEHMLTHPHRESFEQSLVIAGTDGTLERRMRETAAAGNLRGKTGTLSNVNALSGYLKTRSGELLVVSLMGNNYVGPGREVTAVLDRIAVLLAEF